MADATSRENIEAAIADLERVLKRLRLELDALDDDSAQFDDDDLIEVHIAAIRFKQMPDTIRLWCRTEGIGTKRGGRWYVSQSHLRARLGY